MIELAQGAGLFVSSNTKFLCLSRGVREEDLLDHITTN
jgi:hypothetical protein